MNNLTEHRYSAYNTETGKYIDVLPFDECIEMLEYKYKHIAENLKQVYEENEHLKSEHYKDDTIRELKYEISLMEKEYHRGFPIKEEEELTIKSWISQHEKDEHKNCHGIYSYHFYPCAIGTSGIIRCICGAEFEFREID